MQQAVHDRDDEYGPSQARGGEINTHTWMCEQGAACARSAVDIWGSACAWPTITGEGSVGKGLQGAGKILILGLSLDPYTVSLHDQLRPSPSLRG